MAKRRDDTKSKVYPNFGKVWSKENKEAAPSHLRMGKTIRDLVRIYGRNPGAIVTFLRRLGLVVVKEEQVFYEGKLWAIVKGDTIADVTPEMRLNSRMPIEDQLRAVFEQEFRLCNQECSLARSPMDADRYHYAYAQTQWDMVKRIFDRYTVTVNKEFQ